VLKVHHYVFHALFVVKGMWKIGYGLQTLITRGAAALFTRFIFLGQIGRYRQKNYALPFQSLRPIQYSTSKMPIQDFRLHLYVM
jgi:hypothetical protein